MWQLWTGDPQLCKKTRFASRGKKNTVSSHLLWSLSHFLPSGSCLSSCLNLVSDDQCCGSISQKTIFFNALALVSVLSLQRERIKTLWNVVLKDHHSVGKGEKSSARFAEKQRACRFEMSVTTLAWRLRIGN